MSDPHHRRRATRLLVVLATAWATALAASAPRGLDVPTTVPIGLLGTATCLAGAWACRSRAGRTPALALAAVTGLCALGDALWWQGARAADPTAHETAASMVPYLLRYAALGLALSHAVPARDDLVQRTARRLQPAAAAALGASLLLLLTPLRHHVADGSSTGLFTALAALTATGGALGVAAVLLRTRAAARRTGLALATGTVLVGVGDCLVVAGQASPQVHTTTTGVVLVAGATLLALAGAVTAPAPAARSALPPVTPRGSTGVAVAFAVVRVATATLVTGLAGHAAATGTLPPATAGTVGAALLLSVVHVAATAATAARARTAQGLADRDEVSGGWSRRGTLAQLEARLHQGQHGGVVLLDLDGFKAVNDTFGHAAGDELLATVTTRWSTTAGAGAVGRLGGDEFVVLTTATGEDLLDLATRLRRAACTPCTLADGVVVTVGASAGTAAHPDDGTDPDGLLALADARMYADKADRRRGGERRARRAGDAPCCPLDAVQRLVDGAPRA